MKIPAHAAIHLLHQCASGTLATHARDPAGYPYPSLLPYATDAAHRPVLLVSRLAEHTRNAEADARVGFAVGHAPPSSSQAGAPAGAPGGPSSDVLNGPRLTLLGRLAASPADTALVRRYCRYQPDAERYLALGDFFLVTLLPERLRYIGGFGMMGWLEGADLETGAPLEYEAEEALLACFAAAVPPGVQALGIDRLGIDLWVGAERRREIFAAPAADAGALRAAVLQSAARYG